MVLLNSRTIKGYPLNKMILMKQRALIKVAELYLAATLMLVILL